MIGESYTFMVLPTIMDENSKTYNSFVTLTWLLTQLQFFFSSPLPKVICLSSKKDGGVYKEKIMYSMIRARVNLLIVCGFRARVSAMLHSHWPDICSLSHSSRSCLLLEAVRLLLLLSLLLYQYCSNIHQSRPHAYPQNSLLSVVVYVIIVLDKSLLDLGLIFFHLSLSVTSIFFHFLFIGEGIPLLWGISYK